MYRYLTPCFWHQKSCEWLNGVHLFVNVLQDPRMPQSLLVNISKQIASRRTSCFQNKSRTKFWKKINQGLFIQISHTAHHPEDTIPTVNLGGNSIMPRISIGLLVVFLKDVLPAWSLTFGIRPLLRRGRFNCVSWDL